MGQLPKPETTPRVAFQFKYIATDPQVLGGKPIITGTRIRVECILELVASGTSVKDIVAAYPDLPEEAVKEAMRDLCALLQLLYFLDR